MTLTFVVRNISDEAFTYHKSESPAYSFQTSNPHDMFPYLLVTIGSGVSVLKVGILILDMCLSRILSQFYSGLRISIHFFADPNPADFLNADPDPAFKKLYETT